VVWAVSLVATLILGLSLYLLTPREWEVSHDMALVSQPLIWSFVGFLSLLTVLTPVVLVWILVISLQAFIRVRKRRA
jgi:hypothetical protein